MSVWMKSEKNIPNFVKAVDFCGHKSVVGNFTLALFVEWVRWMNVFNQTKWNMFISQMLCVKQWENSNCMVCYKLLNFCKLAILIYVYFFSGPHLSEIGERKRLLARRWTLQRISNNVLLLYQSATGGMQCMQATRSSSRRCFWTLCWKMVTTRRRMPMTWHRYAVCCHCAACSVLSLSATATSSTTSSVCPVHAIPSCWKTWKPSNNWQSRYLQTTTLSVRRWLGSRCICHLTYYR